MWKDKQIYIHTHTPFVKQFQETRRAGLMMKQVWSHTHIRIYGDGQTKFGISYPLEYAPMILIFLLFCTWLCYTYVNHGSYNRGQRKKKDHHHRHIFINHIFVITLTALKLLLTFDVKNNRLKGSPLSSWTFRGGASSIWKFSCSTAEEHQMVSKTQYVTEHAKIGHVG